METVGLVNVFSNHILPLTSPLESEHCPQEVAVLMCLPTLHLRLRDTGFFFALDHSR